MKRIILAALVGVLVSGPATAAENRNIRDLLVLHDTLNDETKKIFEAELGGMGEGMSWYNKETKRLGNPPLYCLPPKLAITDSQYFNIFRRFAESLDARLSLPSAAAGLILLRGLIETFPCKK